MNPVDIVLIVLLSLILAGALLFLILKKNRGCPYCSGGNCAGCRFHAKKDNKGK